MSQLESPRREQVHIGLRTTRDQLAQVQELARRDDRTVSYVIRRALAEHVAANSKEA